MHRTSAPEGKFLLRLNVGGTLYTVGSETLTRYPDTMLSKLATERRLKKEQSNIEDVVFIDRDGDRFKYILDAYRDGSVVVPRTTTIAAVENEMKFFGLSRVTVRQEKPSFDDCVIGAKDGLLELTERLKEMLLDQNGEERLLLQCASSLGRTPEEVKFSSEKFALWAVREAIKYYITNSEGDYEAFLHEYLKIYPSTYCRPDLSYSLGSAYKILRGRGLCSINVLCTRRYHALAFSFSKQDCRLDFRSNSF